ncbi:hypothetical protein BO91_02080 [Candidatus Synechococcus spongiarum LMB bulk10E]|uniref:DUF1036 domain-containing protein n=2 Tax=Candidatus Synechococcus spongiarum TaxID=431041 RepID=A0A1T1CYY1_9SYNE|nr:DUF1036 domain-containing protein [Candidatus Synechococcus spongiarum]OOV33816.1 hypothetical protein BV61_04050 [Candidatus Synechococcus spongiarum LMB bulk15M]OOV34113.1 hypothetical protein BO91_02080 [Candidatus Synechococcus spongiarum LMB bulk10E]OOV36113.1 hypothetical protein BV53_01920 [Candidatus Synechococcus spongiarum LMB bulk15N]
MKMHQQHPLFHLNCWYESLKRRSGTVTERVTILSASLLAFTITAPEPAFAGLEFCNRTTGASTLTLALANYKFGISYVRYGKNNSPDLTIVRNPRWSIRGWWEIPQNECVTAIHHNLNQRHYYYYVYSQDDSYARPGNYRICGHRYNKFHIEYAMNNNKLVQILALKSSGIDSVPVNSGVDLEKACTDLGYGYELLPFNQLDVGDTEEFTWTFID